MPRWGVCRNAACKRRVFEFPDTGPPRVYCTVRCRTEAHVDRLRARLAVFYDGEIEGVPDRMPAPAGEFNVRFRDADPLAASFITVLKQDPCAYCGARAEVMQADHIESFLNGGSGAWENLTAACIACNSSKCDTPLLWWLLTSPRMQQQRYPQLRLVEV